jgi:uncharacterized protein YeaO (DUF488 family)
MSDDKYIKTKRWNDPIDAADGWRVLITRYRPRGIAKENETWDTWWKTLAPSTELHAAAYGKFADPISYHEYKKRYLLEMQDSAAIKAINFIRDYVKRKNTITLLCSSACRDVEKCHRKILKELICKL